ncbi:MAG: TetR/AcrR family transcriptional regulator [Burkholderiaceae bacterium]
MPRSPSIAAEPPRAPRWERRKQARPGELLDAALQLFVEKGYAATRLDDVAARAGVSKGTLYLYFPSKEDLFKAVVRENIVPLIEDFQRDVAASSADSAALLGRFFNEWWSHFGATPLAGIVKLVVGEAGNFPEIARFFQEEVVLPNMALLGSIIQRGIREGEFRQVDLEASIHLWMSPLVLRAIWKHSIEPCCPPQYDVAIERFLALHLDNILATLRASPDLPESSHS